MLVQFQRGTPNLSGIGVAHKFKRGDKVVVLKFRSGALNDYKGQYTVIEPCTKMGRVTLKGVEQKSFCPDWLTHATEKDILIIGLPT